MSFCAGAQINSAQVKVALNAVCASAQPQDALLAALGGGIELSSKALDAPLNVSAQRHQLMLLDGSRLRLDLHRRDKSLAQVIIEMTLPRAQQVKPWLWVVADGRCRTRMARRMEYNAQGEAVAVHVLSSDLSKTRSRLIVDLPAPSGLPADGVMVAMLDAGVNYSLPGIAARLARQGDGSLIGFDYWDMDPRPFDSHPSRSVFLPQRHGTRTASVVLDDAPMALIAPMRYPRNDMTRMTQVVDDIAAHGIHVVNLSLGGNDAEQWRDFATAAARHPDILFIASAGNNGRDIDKQPVYPAALSMPNLITVGSTLKQGLPARGSNWGRQSVDVLIPAEELITTDFSGYAVRVAGSSYAAARVSALAVCYLAAHPQWRAPQLKAAIFALAQAPVSKQLAYVGVGVLPEPTDIERGACLPQASKVSTLGTIKLDDAALYPHANRDDRAAYTHQLTPLTLMWLENTAWSLEALTAALSQAADIYRQCGLRFGQVSIQMLRVPRTLHYFETATAMKLMQEVAPSRPAIWFVQDTLQQPGFDAQAIGRSNVMRGTGLMNTLWMTSKLEHPGVALAHEIYHMIANTGAHVPEKGNLMNADTAKDGVVLWDWQCERIIKTGLAFNLVTSIQ